MHEVSRRCGVIRDGKTTQGKAPWSRWEGMSRTHWNRSDSRSNENMRIIIHGCEVGDDARDNKELNTGYTNKELNTNGSSPTSSGSLIV